MHIFLSNLRLAEHRADPVRSAQLEGVQGKLELGLGLGLVLGLGLGLELGLGLGSESESGLG